MIEQPVSYKIDSIYVEANGIRTYRFKGCLDARSGQFVMLWIPSEDLKPFCVSYQDENHFCITVCKVGEFTEKLFQMKQGDVVGIQGPYGNSFRLIGEKILLVGGGYGSASLAFAADELVKKGAKVTFLIGAKTRHSIIYENRLSKKVRFLKATEDGSAGSKGYATDVMKNLLENETFDSILTCGPELMMEEVISLSNKFNISCQASLERYMKCGFGICGQCCMDGSGIRLCKEGPVFTKEFIKEHISEFGSYSRDATGGKK